MIISSSAFEATTHPTNTYEKEVRRGINNSSEVIGSAGK
jgi:hypothetical protein